MKILGLYNNECALELFRWLESEEHEVVLVTDKLDAIQYFGYACQVMAT